MNSQSKQLALKDGMRGSESYGLGLKMRREGLRLWLLWTGHVYGAGMEYCHGYLSTFLFIALIFCPILRYQNEASSCFALEKLKTEMLLKSFSPSSLVSILPLSVQVLPPFDFEA